MIMQRICGGWRAAEREKRPPGGRTESKRAVLTGSVLTAARRMAGEPWREDEHMQNWKRAPERMQQDKQVQKRVGCSCAGRS